MVSFEKFVKSMLPSLLELKVTPSFCFPFKIPDNPTATILYIYMNEVFAFQIILTFYDPFQGTLVEVVHTLLTYKLLQLQVTQKQTPLLHQLNGVNRKSTSDVSLPT